MRYEKIRTVVYLLIVSFFVVPLFVAIYATVAVALFPLFILAYLLMDRDFEEFKTDLWAACVGVVSVPFDFVKDIFSECV